MSEVILTAEQYALQLLNLPIYDWVPPQHGVYTNYAGVNGEKPMISIVMDRRGPYQCELFVVQKDVKDVETHIHPGVDSVELRVSGCFAFTHNGIEKAGLIGTQPIGENEMIIVPEDGPHSGRLIGPCASFFSFQHWKDGTPPTTVGDRFKIVPKPNQGER